MQMEAIRVQQVVAKDGEVLVKGVPYKKGQVVEIIVFQSHQVTAPRAHLTVSKLRRSGLIGIWKDRNEIKDSSTYARQIREQSQKRGKIKYDFAG